MNIKLTLGERLKDLRVERHLKLETLAEFYGVTTDYLLGVTENKKRPDQDDGSGDGKRLKKDSADWYKKAITTNGEDLT